MKKSRFRSVWVAGAAVALLVLVVFIPSFLTTIITGGCEDFILSKVPSPSGRLIATVFVRDCGATTASNTQVSLNSRSYLSGLKKQTSFLVFEGEGTVKVSWINDSTLTVILPKAVKLFHQDEKQRGVTIRYVEGR